MVINDFHIQLATAYPDLKKIPTRKGRTLRGDIETDDGVVPAYIKLLSIGDVAKEALCAVLARCLYLPVPQPFYVYTDPINAGQASGNRFNIAFGLQEELLPFRRLRDDDIAARELLSWSSLYQCAAFDAWIANGDRFPDNLLFAGNHDFWMIDHDDALAGYLLPSSSVNSRLFEIIRAGKSEHELYQIRERMLSYAKDYAEIDWNHIKKLVRPIELPGSEQYFDGYIEQLRKRGQHMRSIITTELGIKQASIEFIEDRSNNPEVIKKT